MSVLAPARVGWCPGALRPMRTGDGLILRVKPRGSALGLAQAACIAEVATRYGNGALDLTTRANLQIRGVEDDGLDAVLRALDAVGLIDRDPAAEAVRNVVSSPLSGHDAKAVLDIRPIVEALERRLCTDAALHALPPKFSVLIDDGGTLSLDDVPADIRFEAVVRDGGPAFAVGLGDDRTRGLCAAADLPEAFAALVRAFVAARAVDPALRRMRHLVARDGAAALVRRAGLSLLPSREKEAPRPLNTTCAHGRGEKGTTVLDLAVPFGRMRADQFEALIDAAASAGGSDLRLTPWRAILVPGLMPDAVRVAKASCAAAGFIIDPADPRRVVAACPGAPGCHRGSTPVLDHAARLARVLAPGPRNATTLHVSGCGKGCAHAGKAPLTLIGHDGLYDLVVDGFASDAPVRRDMTYEDAERCLASFGRLGLERL